jgi:hypothetical protein
LRTKEELAMRYVNRILSGALAAVAALSLSAADPGFEDGLGGEGGGGCYSAPYVVLVDRWSMTLWELSMSYFELRLADNPGTAAYLKLQTNDPTETLISSTGSGGTFGSQATINFSPTDYWQPHRLWVRGQFDGVLDGPQESVITGYFQNWDPNCPSAWLSVITHD